METGRELFLPQTLRLSCSLFQQPGILSEQESHPVRAFHRPPGGAPLHGVNPDPAPQLQGPCGVWDPPTATYGRPGGPSPISPTGRAHSRLRDALAFRPALSAQQPPFLPCGPWGTFPASKEAARFRRILFYSTSNYLFLSLILATFPCRFSVSSDQKEAWGV